MRLVLASFVILGGCLLTSCREAKVESYRVPKEAPPPAPPAGMAGADMAATPVPTADGAALSWQAPAAWISQAPAPMRKASYKLTSADGEAELTVTAFPGDVGGDLANVNRWRNQLQLPPLTADALPSTLQTAPGDALTFKWTELDGGAQRTLAAWVMHNGSTWFFKLTGATAAVSAEKTRFLEFLKTVKAD